MSVFISFGFLVVSGSILINRGGGKFQVKGIAVCSARAQCNIQNNLRDDQNSTQTGDFKNKIKIYWDSLVVQWLGQCSHSQGLRSYS